MTSDDFDIISQNGKHLGPSGEFNQLLFRDMMTGELSPELWRFMNFIRPESANRSE